MARVSAIIIVLNGESYIKEAIESVRAQTFEDWDLLIVDDGSSDSTLLLAQQHAAADPDRIRVIRHADGATHGMSASRNLGIERTGGEFIAFLDADDVWLPEKLGEQVKILDRYREAAMVYGRTLIWKSWAAEAEADDFFYELGVTPDSVQFPPRLFLQLLRNVYQSPTTCNAMLRRTAILDIGGFDARLRGMFEDQFLFAKLLLSYPAYVSSHCWAKYRQHSGSASARTSRDEARKQHLSYLRSLRRFFRDRGKALSGERLALERTIKIAEAAQAGRFLKSGIRKLIS